MKKLLVMVAALMMVAATGFAQDSVPAKKVNSKKNDLETMLKPLTDKLSALPEAEQNDENVKKLALEFTKENENEAGAYILTNLLAHMMPIEEVLKLAEESEYFKENATVKQNMATWRIQQETSEGKQFKDFSAEYEGKVTKLSDYVGKGKYVLVDFWASWCGPCRAEIPNLINVYNKYKGDKFEVLGVATWDEPADTKKAIKELNIPYPQMMNAQKAGSDAYGISGIPQIILFGPDGKIVKRNLRGEALEKAVAEALK